MIYLNSKMVLAALGIISFSFHVQSQTQTQTQTKLVSRSTSSSQVSIPPRPDQVRMIEMLMSKQGELLARINLLEASLAQQKKISHELEVKNSISANVIMKNNSEIRELRLALSFKDQDFILGAIQRMTGPNANAVMFQADLCRKSLISTELRKYLDNSKSMINSKVLMYNLLSMHPSVPPHVLSQNLNKYSMNFDQLLKKEMNNLNQIEFLVHSSCSKFNHNQTVQAF